MSDSAPWVEEVIRFWFEELEPADWFGANPTVDTTIRDRFAPLRAALKAHPPEPAGLDAHSILAAVIVLDQFSRNMLRNWGEAYATDALALHLARHAVDAGLDRTLDRRQRPFLYMPFMHSEDPDDQARSVALFEALGEEQPLMYARQHKDVVDRFGRFPHRNAALGRPSTAEEIAFVRTTPAFP